MATVTFDEKFIIAGDCDSRGFSFAIAKKLGGKKDGILAAALLQQIYFWSKKKGGVDTEEGHFFYKTAREWGEELGGLSRQIVHKLLKILRELNLIIVRKLNHKKNWDSTNFYQPNIAAIEALFNSETAETLEISECTKNGHLRVNIQTPTCNYSDSLPIFPNKTSKQHSQGAERVEQMNQSQDNSKDELVEDLEPATNTTLVENSSSGDDRLPRRSTSEIKKLHNAPWYRGNVQERLNPQRLLPEGAWSIDGKLDPNFQEWLAKKWLEQFGDRYKGDLFAAKADVLAHFVNQPEKLPIRWQQYHEEYKYRFEVTKQTIEAGVKIDTDYQQRLGRNSRAVTTPLGEKHNLLYNQSLQAYSDASAAPALESSDTDIAESIDNIESREFSCLDATTESIENIQFPQKGGEFNAPPNADNAAAYKPFVPTPEPTATTEEIKSWWRDAIDKLKPNISFSKKAAPEIKPEDRENIPVATNPYVDFTGLTAEEIDRKIALLNDWLKVPALANEAVRLAKQTSELEVIVENGIVVAIDLKF